MIANAPQTPGVHLVAQAIDGCQDSFTSLLQTNDDRMRAVAYQVMGDRHAMDDVLQTAYLKAYRKLSSFRAEASFSSWLHRIVVNTCFDELAKRKRQSVVPLDVVAEAAADVHIENDFTTKSALHAALQDLTPDMRAVVILIDGQGLSYSEAAAALNVNVGTVRSRLSRARSTLRTNLGLAEEPS